MGTVAFAIGFVTFILALVISMAIKAYQTRGKASCPVHWPHHEPGCSHCRRAEDERGEERERPAALPKDVQDIPPPAMKNRAAIEHLIEQVGEERFAVARDWAWRTAATTGHGWPEEPDAASETWHELVAPIWYPEGEPPPWVERLRLLFLLYREVPCYAVLSESWPFSSQWDAAARKLFWTEYRALLSDPDDRLAEPVAYTLWCQYFEGSETVADAWAEMARPSELSERGMQRLLESCGPVPFELKKTLYNTLLEEPHWWKWIRLSLMHSENDFFGDYDPVEAEVILAEIERRTTYWASWRG